MKYLIKSKFKSMIIKELFQNKFLFMKQEIKCEKV